MNKLIKAVLLAGCVGVAAPVSAVPILQIYLEGATYDDASETWVATFSETDPLRLWAVGNVGGEGGKGTIFNVRLSLAYAMEDADAVSFDITGSQTNGFGGFTDPSIATDPLFVKQVTDGSTPLLSDGSALPSHGEYGSDTAWSEYYLGNFTLKDSPGGDFIDELPTPGATSAYQISVYEISISGTDTVHFDLYDGVQQGKKFRAVFAPFSHDGEGDGGTKVPDGGATAMLLGGALAGIGWMRRFMVKA